MQILTIVLVRACDKLERCGEDIVQTCYMLQENIGKSNVSDELMLLVEYLKALAPKISASGLFYINRKLFSSFFAVTTSYIIIILQFRNGWIFTKKIDKGFSFLIYRKCWIPYYVNDKFTQVTCSFRIMHLFEKKFEWYFSLTIGKHDVVINVENSGPSMIENWFSE